MRWEFGEAIVRREVLNDGRPWVAFMVYVVEDSDDQLVTYLPPDTPFAFLPGTFPTSNGRHPWDQEPRHWLGHGVLMVQRPKEDHAVWHFWAGPDRSFTCWYINLQEASRRTAIGYDTQDLELDLVVRPDGSWFFKDLDKLDAHVARGRYTRKQISEVVALGERLAARLSVGDRWWNAEWTTWTPRADWVAHSVPDGWDLVPTREPFQLDHPDC